MPSVSWNRDTWNDKHEWNEEGDEWSGMAAHCGQPYLRWKQALLDEFLLPHVNEATDVVEVAPGHGRWSEALVARARSVALVDISPSCLDACRERFSDAASVSYHLTDGSSLPGVADRSVDFVWSFDSFVHIDQPVIEAYAAEFARVLRPGGRVVLHHADKRNWALPVVRAGRRLGAPGRAAGRLVSQGRLRDSGNRSEVSREQVAAMLRARGFAVELQTSSWGSAGEFTVSKYHDCITTARRG